MPRGLWGCPTLINNVETFANITPIVRNGAEWFANIGTAKSKKAPIDTASVATGMSQKRSSR